VPYSDEKFEFAGTIGLWELFSKDNNDNGKDRLQERENESLKAVADRMLHPFF
jgi:hypothetical protein